MTFAYADPPYLGCCGLYGHNHVDGHCYDSISSHAALVERLQERFPDGWAMSCSSPSLRDLLPLCPDDARVAAWVKPFAVFKPNVNPAYAWEPVIFRGGRRYSRESRTVRDWDSFNITLRRGLPGAKPETFAFWLFALLNIRGSDEFVDLFPGSGVITRAFEKLRLYHESTTLRRRDRSDQRDFWDSIDQA